MVTEGLRVRRHRAGVHMRAGAGCARHPTDATERWLLGRPPGGDPRCQPGTWLPCSEQAATLANLRLARRARCGAPIADGVPDSDIYK